MGRGSESHTTSMSLAASCSAATRAKVAESRRVSWTIATRGASPRARIASASPWAVSRTTTVLKRFVPGPTVPRRPPVPIGSGPANASASSARAARAASPTPAAARTSDSSAARSPA